MSSPFDEVRYKTLLNGLEAIEIPLSKLERTRRIDAEFFSKEYLRAEVQLRKHQLYALPELVNVSDGNHYGISEKFQEEGIPYYRGQDVNHFFIEQSSPICIDEETYWSPKIPRSHLKQNDVLLSIIGTIGETSLVTSSKKATCSCKLAILRSHKVIPEYLAIFLKSKYGRYQVDRFTRGAIQMGLLLEDADQIFIPPISDSFQKGIQKVVKAAHAKLEQSKSLYAQAEATLLDELGLKNWKPPKESAAVKSFSESFGKSGRLDAEYFQPASDVIIAKLKKFEHARVGGVVQMMNGYAWKSGFFKERGDEGFDEGEPFIRIRDCKPGSLDIAELDRIEYEYASGEDVEKARAGDIVVGMDGLKWFYASLITKPCYINQRVSWLRLLENSKLTAEYLTLFLDSIAGQTQLLREMTIADTVGHLSNNGIASVFVPILPNGVIKKITKQFSDSFITKQESKRLLELAKQAVETAIEKGEKAGSKMVQ